MRRIRLSTFVMSLLLLLSALAPIMLAPQASIVKAIGESTKFRSLDYF